MSCDYVEAIHSSRHTLWPIWLHIVNVIKTRRILSNEKEDNDLMMYATCLLLSQNIFKIWGCILLHQHFKDYEHKLIEDIKSCVDHDDDWRRINKGLVVMNHTSEKSNWRTWRRGTGCDGEEQVKCWVQYQSCHENLQSSKYWYLLNQEIKETWTRRDVLIA
jgi:hypothetical protein